MDVEYQIRTLQTKAACHCQPISWSMAAILRDSAAVVVVVLRTRPRATPLAMVTMKTSMHGFPLLSSMGVVLRYNEKTSDSL